MPNKTANDSIPPGFKLRHTLWGHKGEIRRIAWSPDGHMLASPSSDETIRIWDTESGELRWTLEGHSAWVNSVAWSPDGRTLASGSGDRTVRLWNTETGELHRTLEGHPSSVCSVAWSPDGQLLASAFERETIWLWDTSTTLDASAETKGLYRTIRAHSPWIGSVSWSPDGQTLALGALDGVQLWDRETGKVHRRFSLESVVFITSLAWSPNGQILASGARNAPWRVDLWDPEARRPTTSLEGHTNAVTGISFSFGGYLFSLKSYDNTVRLWRCDTWEMVAILNELTERMDLGGLAFHPTAPVLATLGGQDRVIRIWDLDLDALLGAAPMRDTIHYINANVMLVGERGVGKSGLGTRIACGEFRLTESTHGARLWRIPVSEYAEQAVNLPRVEADVTLWDLGGQPDYRLVHQLFLDHADVALLLFDSSDPADPFRGVPYWAKVLRKQAPPHAVKLLVSARCDVSPVTVSEREINRILSQYELDGFVRTSAKTGEGVDTLVELIVASIPWDQLPFTVTPLLFQVVREYLLECKEAGRTLVLTNEVQDEVRRRFTEQQVTRVEIDTVVHLLQAQGLVYGLVEPARGRVLVLLSPEPMNQYASSIIQAARNHPDGIGAVPERDILTAQLTFIGFERLERGEERIVLESTIELLIQRGLCFREMGLLVFPSQINVTRSAYTRERPPTEVTYQFSGSVEAIYASLVVRLSYTDYFRREDQWKYAVEFSRDGHRLGFAMQHVEEGTGELEIYFYPGVSEFDRVTFIRFITDHLRTKGIDIQERIRLYCPQCGEEVENLAAIERRVQTSKLDIPCQYCATMVLIPRSIEERYRSDRSYVEKQRELSTTIERRTAQEVQAFKTDRKQYTKAELDRGIHILHLSDIHLGTEREAGKYLTQLETDLRKELQINRLEYLIISGDVVSYSTPEEYKVAFDLVDGLVKRFGLDASRVVIVPGNHDLNWDLSADAYAYVPKHKLPDSLTDEYISASDVGALRRDVDLYKQRFAHFNAHFYRKVYTGQEYPLDHAKQGILYPCPDDHLLFLALNSAWEVDHHYRQRASINMEALSHALDQLQDSRYDDWLKIAVWHHPVTGREMMNDEFLQLLAVHGFQICMHGHIHEAQQGFYAYDLARGIHIIGAGTFGAPLRKQAGIPLQYNLLILDPETRTLTVEMRKKEKPDGVWSADARWGDKNNPVPRYTIQLK